MILIWIKKWIKRLLNCQIQTKNVYMQCLNRHIPPPFPQSPSPKSKCSKCWSLLDAVSSDNCLCISLWPSLMSQSVKLKLWQLSEWRFILPSAFSNNIKESLTAIPEKCTVLKILYLSEIFFFKYLFIYLFNQLASELVIHILIYLSVYLFTYLFIYLLIDYPTMATCLWAAQMQVGWHHLDEACGGHGRFVAQKSHSANHSSHRHRCSWSQ